MYKQRGVFAIGMKRRSEAGRRGLPSRSTEVNSCVYQQVSNRRRVNSIRTLESRPTCKSGRRSTTWEGVTIDVDVGRLLDLSLRTQRGETRADLPASPSAPGIGLPPTGGCLQLRIRVMGPI